VGESNFTDNGKLTENNHIIDYSEEFNVEFFEFFKNFYNFDFEENLNTPSYFNIFDFYLKILKMNLKIKNFLKFII
jgi:N-acetyl-gamma-glutamylphosphate reductase